MAKIDLDERIQVLNKLLGWAREHAISITNTGRFAMIDAAEDGIASIAEVKSLMLKLRELGYIYRCGGTKQSPIWYVKPNGLVTIEEYRREGGIPVDEQVRALQVSLTAAVGRIEELEQQLTEREGGSS